MEKRRRILLKRRRRRQRRICFMMLALVFGLYLLAHAGSQIEPRAELQPIKTGNIIYEDKPLNEVAINNNLQLVNKEYLLPNNGRGTETMLNRLESADGILPLAQNDILVNQEALQAAEKWMQEASQKGYYQIYITSGFRTYEKQASLYQEMEDKAYVQYPGASEHQTGLAIDISAREIGIKQLANYSEGRWLAESAWKYGFIMRYPEDKVDITGIAHEPWHFRYVGFPHAYYCFTQGLCFEEYIEYLKKEGGYEIIIGETEYYVYYCSGENDIIKVPQGMEYQVSEDNTGGYIVTAVKGGGK